MPNTQSETFEEAVIDADRGVIDVHHHLWRKPPNDYLYPELLADLNSGHNVLGTIYVEGGSLHRPVASGGTMYRADGPDLFKPVGETEFANGVAAMAASGLFGSQKACAGIIGFVDLPLGDAVRPVLDAHMRACGSRFKGVRHITGWDDDPAFRNPSLHLRPGLLAEPGFREGLRLLQSMGLLFETTLFHPQLPQLAAAARAVPDLTIVACHLGYPIGVGRYQDKPREQFEDWRANMRDLAGCPNVVVKAGGLLSPRSGLTPKPVEGPITSAMLAELWRPYVETCIELFGTERCMFESNFPVDGKYVSYRTLWNAFKRLGSAYSDSEQDALLAGNARRVYRLDI